MISPRQIIEQNRKVYNAIAAHFSQTREFVWADLKPLAKYTRDGDTVLDLGCGNGRLYQIFADLQVRYVGIDQSEELIALAKKKFPEARFLVGNMLDTRVTEQSVDVVYCIAAFQHIPTTELRLQVLREIKRVLKPGGTLIMTNWNLYSDWARKKYTGDEQGDYYIPWKTSFGKNLGTRYYHGFLLEELLDLTEQTGFEMCEQYYVKRGEVASIGNGNNIISIAKPVEKSD